MKETELTVIKHNILVADRDRRLVVAAGPFLADVLGDENIDKVAGVASKATAEHPDRTIFVDEETFAAGIRNGVTAAVIGLNEEREFSGEVFAVARVKLHDREKDDDGLPRDKLIEGANLNLDNALEVGTMVNLQPDVKGQGRRAFSAITHVAWWETRLRGSQVYGMDLMAATNQTNGNGEGSVVKAGGLYVGSKTTTRLEHPPHRDDEPQPTGPVTVKIYTMHPKGEFVPFVRRGH